MSPPVSLNLKAYRERSGMTQVEVVATIYRWAVARGEKPGFVPVRRVET